MYMAITAAVVIVIFAAYLAVIFFRKRKIVCGAFLIIPVTADDKLFERRVRALYWEEAFADPISAKEIVLVIVEFSDNAYIARRLASELHGVYAVHISALGDFLRRKCKEYKKTDT